MQPKEKNKTTKQHIVSKTYLKKFKNEDQNKCFYFKTGIRRISSCSPKKLTVKEEFYTFVGDNNEYSLEDFFQIYENDYNHLIKLLSRSPANLNDDFVTFLSHFIALQHIKTDKFRDIFVSVVNQVFTNHDYYKKEIEKADAQEERALVPSHLSNYFDMIDYKIRNEKLNNEELAKYTHLLFIMAEYIDIAEAIKHECNLWLLKSDDQEFITSDAPLTIDTFVINNQECSFIYFPLTKNMCMILYPNHVNIEECKKTYSFNFVERINNNTAVNAKELVIASNPNSLLPYIE